MKKTTSNSLNLLCIITLSQQLWSISIPTRAINEWLYEENPGIVFPFFTKPFIDQLKDWDITNWSVFHWTGGHDNLGCTSAWFARRCKNLICIEWIQIWQDALTEFCRKNNLINTTCVTRTIEKKTKYHQIFGTREVNLWSEAGENSAYVQAINEFDLKYDCIIIDGVHRNACAHIALNYVKSYGIIIVNNVNQISQGINSTGIIKLFEKYPHFSFKEPGHIDWSTDYWIITD